MCGPGGLLIVAEPVLTTPPSLHSLQFVPLLSILRAWQPLLDHSHMLVKASKEHAHIGYNMSYLSYIIYISISVCICA